MESGPPVEDGAVALPPRFERFGRYVLLERIAVGGMAQVHRAIVQGVEGFRRTFVIKRILADKASSPTFISMFCDEARICAALHHPNVVQVHDFGQVGGSYFLAMEYLHGKDLSSVMRATCAANVQVPPGLATYVAREAAVGLHYAHTLRGAAGQSLGIVHRDVSPSNIMLLFAGGVKLLDFGIAKVAKAASAANEREDLQGKYGYLAPEQVSAVGVDARADIFALGITLWEMLVGRRLFAGKDDRETLRNVLLMDVPPPSSLRPELPVALDRIVLRALERRRDLRYATADELARDCDGVLAAVPADERTLRAFLGDLFASESSASPFEAPELPDLPPADASTAHESPSAARPRLGSRARWAGAAVLAASALVFLGAARLRPASATPSEATSRSLPAAPWAPIIVPLAAPLEEAAAPVAVHEPEATRSPSQVSTRTPSGRRRATRKVRLGSGARHRRPALAADLTLNPF